MVEEAELLWHGTASQKGGNRERGEVMLVLCTICSSVECVVVSSLLLFDNKQRRNEGMRSCDFGEGKMCGNEGEN